MSHGCNGVRERKLTPRFKTLKFTLHTKKGNNPEETGANFCKGKSPEVPFHGITLPYSHSEVILILAPIQQEAKHDQEKLSAELN